jgi:1-acyl-sn-glycerol-3-phosphate acyltransferase
MKAHKIFAPIIRFFQRIHVTGLENIPSDGPIIFCSNHIAAKDPVLIAAAAKRQITFIAKKELFSVPVIGRIIKKLGAISLDRAGSDLGAIKKSVGVLKSGGALAIFPQGHRYPGVNPAGSPTKNGAALLAYRSGSNIVPVCIKVKDFKYHFLGKVEIIFGKPINNSDLGFKNGGNEEYKAATDKIFAEIIALAGYAALPSPKTAEGENS